MHSITHKYNTTFNPILMYRLTKNHISTKKILNNCSITSPVIEQLQLLLSNK